MNDYKIMKYFGDGKFESAEKIGYKKAETGRQKSWHKISRTNLIGQFNESCSFELRMFAIEPGGYSSFEKHIHIHAVICASGEGLVLLDDTWHKVCPNDVMFIGANVPHQLRCAPESKSSFEFFCIVDIDRDKPTLLGTPPSS